MTQDKDQMRAEFEAWCCPQADKNAIAKFDDGFYMSAKTSMAWSAWQAALASAPTGVMEDGQWNIEGANIGEIEAYEHGVRSTMSIVQRILDGDSDIGPLSSPMRDYRALMDEVRALKASAAQGVPPEPSDEDIDAVFNAMPDGMNGWLKSWGYRQFARALLQRWGGHGLTDDLVWCDCGDGYAKGTDEAIHIASGEGCSNCLAGTKPEPAAACHITLPPAPHKLGDVELWPRSVIEQHVADLEQAVRYGADLFQQAEQDWRKDAERYQALKQRFACIDFKYDFGSGKDSTVLCFDFGVDQTAPFFAGLDANVDAAIAAQKGQA